MHERLFDAINSLEDRLAKAEAALEQARLGRGVRQPQQMVGMHLALCVDTKDPTGNGRVRFYTPALNEDPAADPYARPFDKESLPWASPISTLGGFDDSGSPWVPPAGSMLAVVFENGNREAPYYLGTIWNRDRGPDGRHLFEVPVQEYFDLYEGRRGGYLAGKNDGSQVLQPWNGESYNMFDRDSDDISTDPAAAQRQSHPHVRGFKTPEKHSGKFVDGNPECNFKGKRLEWNSSRGQKFVLKDDHMHPSSAYAHGAGTGDCARPSDCAPATGKFRSPFFKREEEMRAEEGSGFGANNAVDLPQSGFQIISLSGHTVVGDDSVDQPKGVPGWELPFDTGCNDLYKGRFYMRSATGHMIEMSDVEDAPGNRGPENYIRVLSAAGNMVELNDHTLPGGCVAGGQRGVTIRSTANNTLVLADGENRQCSPPRAGGGEPQAKAKQGFCLLRSGYGLQLLMRDDFSQEETQQQYIQLLAPQTNNAERGPHMLLMQEKPAEGAVLADGTESDGKGLLFLRSGGVYYRSSYDDCIEVTGTEDHDANKSEQVNGNYLVDVKEYYYNKNRLTMLWAEDYAFIIAGKDCPPPEDAGAAGADAVAAAQEAVAAAQEGREAEATGTPCIYPVVVAKKPWVCPFTNFVHFGVESMSDRVFASASNGG